MQGLETLHIDLTELSTSVDSTVVRESIILTDIAKNLILKCCIFVSVVVNCILSKTHLKGLEIAKVMV